MTSQVSISSVRLRNFKAFKEFTLQLRHMNVLVGPNNSGKSTIIGVFRVLAAGIQRARYRRAERFSIGRQTFYGYAVPEESIPISLENVHTDYSEQPSTVTFRCTNGRDLVLTFPGERECFMYAGDGQRASFNPQAFSKSYPLKVGVVPVLGPLEHEEEIVTERTVRRGLVTHRASGHFRNYWHKFPQEFELFQQLVQQTWPDMDITPPEIVPPDRLAMFCTEARVDREMYWAGFGFQVWCQILSHAVRERACSVFLIDEPEIYLHPDLQRQLLALLRDLGPDIVLATHSSELVAEAEASEIVLIDKRSRSAKRVRGLEGVQAAATSLGSVHNVTLTQLARTRRVLFVEGNDYKILRQVAKRFGYAELASGAFLAAVPLGGFPAASRLKGACLAFRKAVGQPLLMAAVLDRDYRSTEQAEAFAEELKSDLNICHIHERKELENYLLVPSALERALLKAVRARATQTNGACPEIEQVSELLESLTDPLRSEVESQSIARREESFRNESTDRATRTKETLSLVEERWKVLDTRIELVPGKQVLAALNAKLQEKYQVSLTTRMIVDSLEEGDVGSDLRKLLRGLNNLCKQSPD